MSAASEKQRYENAQSFLTAIDPLAKTSTETLGVKESFESAVSEALEALHRALEKVISLGSRDRKILESMVRLCAKIWLECCSQRYRLLVIVPDGKEDFLTSPRREARSLKLIARPELKRYGNSQGEELSSSESVTGWQGSLVTYPVR